MKFDPPDYYNVIKEKLQEEKEELAWLKDNIIKNPDGKMDVEYNRIIKNKIYLIEIRIKELEEKLQWTQPNLTKS